MQRKAGGDCREEKRIERKREDTELKLDVVPTGTGEKKEKIEGRRISWCKREDTELIFIVVHTDTGGKYEEIEGRRKS